MANSGQNIFINFKCPYSSIEASFPHIYIHIQCAHHNFIWGTVTAKPEEKMATGEGLFLHLAYYVCKLGITNG